MKFQGTVFFSFAWTQNLADLKETNIFLRLQLAKKRKEYTQMKQISHFFGKFLLFLMRNLTSAWFSWGVNAMV